MREVVFDTETTGFGAEDHRIIEIGAVELINRLPTGRTFHRYLNPERPIEPGAIKIHGITDERVRNEPRFADVVAHWLDFVGDAPLVAHNAEFDMAFLTRELELIGLPAPKNVVIDTLLLAREKLPGQRHSLDALCSTYNVDSSGRTFHSALLDAHLLAEVYVELTGGLQASLTLEPGTLTATSMVASGPVVGVALPVVSATTAECAAHIAWLQGAVPHALWDIPDAAATAPEKAT
jgi:DNA polymerase-3 subunit epsilon